MNLMLTQGNALRIGLADESVHMVCCSPPYWGLRSYGIGTEHGELGLEKTPEEYVERMVVVFREVWRVMRHDASLWLNMGDSYAGSGGHGNQRDDANKGNFAKFKNPNSLEITKGNGLKPKDLCGIPWRLAFALQADGWWLRSDNPWIKNNPMPESADDRPNKCIEYMFLLTKSQHYYFDMEAVRISTKFSNTHSRGTKLSPPKEAANTAAGYGHKDWTKYTSEQVKERNWRNHDLFLKSIQHILDGEPTMLVDGDVPIATFCNTKGFSGAHFATFPPALVEPCIKAGTSEYGVCGKCGNPWVRDKTSKIDYNNNHEDLSLPQMSEDIREKQVRERCTEDRGTSMVLQGVRHEKAETTSSEKYNAGETKGAAIQEDSSQGDSKKKESISISGERKGIDVSGQQTLLPNREGQSKDRQKGKKVGKDRERKDKSTDALQQAARSLDESRGEIHDRRLAENTKSPKKSLQRLSNGVYRENASDNRSHNTIEQRGEAQPREHSGNVSIMQFKEVQPHCTDGWHPTCKCNAPIKKAIVFDPFVGSGTTLQVARALGRNGIGLDLSMEYLHLARQRLSLDALEAWGKGISRSDDGKDGTHKNKNVPGRKTHSIHDARKEKGITDLPMFEELCTPMEDK